MAIPPRGSGILYLLVAAAILEGCSQTPCGFLYPQREELARATFPGKGWYLSRLGILVSAPSLPKQGVCTPVSQERLELLVNGSPHPFELIPFYEMRIFAPLKPYPSAPSLEVRWKGCKPCTILEVPLEPQPQGFPSPTYRFSFRERIPAQEIPVRFQGVRFTSHKRIGVDPELKVEHVDLWIYEARTFSGEVIPVYLLTPTALSDLPEPYLPVIYIHGFRSCKETVFALADMAARLGIVLMAFDLKGHGERSGLPIPYECGTTLPWQLFLQGGLPAFTEALEEAAHLARALSEGLAGDAFPELKSSLKEKLNLERFGILAHSLGGEALFLLLLDPPPRMVSFAFSASGIGYPAMLPYFLDPHESRSLVPFLPPAAVGAMAEELGRAEPARLLMAPPLERYLFAQIMSEDQVLPPVAYHTLATTLALTEDVTQEPRRGRHFLQRIPGGHLSLFFPGRGLENRLVQWQLFQFLRASLSPGNPGEIELLPWDHPAYRAALTRIYGTPPLP